MEKFWNLWLLLDFMLIYSVCFDGCGMADLGCVMWYIGFYFRLWVFSIVCIFFMAERMLEDTLERMFEDIFEWILEKMLENENNVKWYVKKIF